MQQAGDPGNKEQQPLWINENLKLEIKILIISVRE